MQQSLYKLEPNAQVRIGLDTSPSRSVTSTCCGFVVVTSSANYPTATIQVDGAVINPANLPKQIRPNCRVQGDGSYRRMKRGHSTSKPMAATW